MLTHPSVNFIFLSTHDTLERHLRGYAELHLWLRQSAREGFLLMKRFTHPVRTLLFSSGL